MHAKLLQSCLTLCGPMNRVHQAPLSMGFSRQEYWGGLPFPTPGDLSNPGIESVSLAFPALVGEFSTTVTPGKPVHFMGFYKFIMTCSHHYSISKYPLCSTYSSLPPSSPSVTDLFTMSIVLPFLDHHVVGIIHAYFNDSITQGNSLAIHERLWRSIHDGYTVNSRDVRRNSLNYFRNFIKNTIPCTR